MRYNKYIERCRNVMYKYGEVTSVADIAKHYEKSTKNTAPYKKAIEKLMEREWKRKGKKYLLRKTPLNNTAKDLTKNLSNYMDKLSESKNVEGMLDTMLCEVTSNPSQFIDNEWVIFRLLIQTKIKADGFSKTEKMIKKIMDAENPKTYKSIKK